MIFLCIYLVIFITVSGIVLGLTIDRYQKYGGVWYVVRDSLFMGLIWPIFITMYIILLIEEHKNKTKEDESN